MKGKRVAAFGGPHPRRSLTGEGDMLATEARLVADHAAGAALALQAVTHGDARWFALNRKVKLPAAAGGASSGHVRSVGCTSKRCTMGSEKRARFPLGRKAGSKSRSAAVSCRTEVCYPFGRKHGRYWAVKRREFISLLFVGITSTFIRLTHRLSPRSLTSNGRGLFLTMHRRRDGANKRLCD